MGSLDGFYTLHAQLFLPKNGTRKGRGPAVIFTHGGPPRQMYAAFHYCSDYAQEYALNQYFQYQGFAVLSINYRSGVGYGRDFRECRHGQGCGAAGAAEYNDVKAG